jgi:hypothetical protein
VRRWRVFRVISVLIAVMGLEVGLGCIDPPMSWTAGSFDGHRYSLRLWKWLDHLSGGEFNRYGYRDVDWAQSTSSPRAAFLGDSRMYGLYVEADESIPSRLRAHAAGWEGMNFGLVGTTPVELLDHMLDDVLEFQPSAAIISVDINSSVLGLACRREFSRWDNTGTNLLRSSSILRWSDLAWRAWRSGGRRVRVQELDTYGTDLSSTLVRLQEAGVGRRVVLVGWTPMPAIEGLWDPETYDRYRTQSRATGRAHGATVVEVEALLAGMPHADAFVGPGLHYSAAASDRIAAGVATVLAGGEGS